MIFWSDIQTSLPFFFIKSFNRILKNERLPNLEGSLFYLASDYSGNQKNSNYDVYSFVHVDITKMYTWELRRRELRLAHMPSNRRMSYKGLNDKNKQAFLLPFLQLSADLHGLILTVVVSKKITSLCIYPNELKIFCEFFGLECGWNYKSLERTVRILNFGSILQAGLARPKQEIYWITDEDDFTGEAKIKDVHKIIGKLSSLYGNHLPSCTLGIGTAKIDPGDNLEEDLLSIVDLSAGAICDVVNAVSISCGGRIYPQFPVQPKIQLSSKASEIFDWYETEFVNLKKTTILIEQHEGNKYAVSKFHAL